MIGACNPLVLGTYPSQRQLTACSSVFSSVSAVNLVDKPTAFMIAPFCAELLTTAICDPD
jgi:hypothetical protein